MQYVKHVQYQPGQVIDHYLLLSLLSMGISSSVYLALDKDTGQKVVLKFSKDNVVGGRAIFERYQREVQIGKLLCHPHIAQHLNQDEKRQENYLVLEYLQGRTLRALIVERASALLAPDEVVTLLIPVCEAVCYAHKKGVIHQDIKPDNIMLLENGDVKVFDFGIAQIEGDRKNFVLGPLVGTPDYMAPERLQGKQGSECTDVYAIGIVLYELLCGRTPFHEKDGFSLIGEHISHDPPDILNFNPSLTPQLATFVMRAVRRDADKRYQHVEDMLYDLCHIQDIQPLSYTRDPPKFGGRYRQIIALSLLIAGLILILVLFGVLAQFVHHIR